MLQVPTPTVPAPPTPTEASLISRNETSVTPRRDSPTRFSTVRSEVRSGANRIDITDPQQWSPGEVAAIRNQEAKKVRDIGSLIFETPIQHDYQAGVEVRSLLPTEQLEEIDDRLAVVDIDPATGAKFVKFWVDEIPVATEGSPSQRRERDTPVQEPVRKDRDRESLSSEEVWIITIMISHEGNEFPWVVVRMKEGNVFPLVKDRAHLG